MLGDLTVAFPRVLAADVGVVCARLTATLATSWGFDAHLPTGTVTIPSRVYLEPFDPEGLSETQRRIADCICTRHHDGFEREAHLMTLIAHAEPWLVPFVWVLLGEYVFEIVERIVAAAPTLDAELYREFVRSNPRLVALTWRRAISYWDLNRDLRGRFRRFEDHPAHAVFLRFGACRP